MRTLIGAVSGHGSMPSASCTVSAAETASAAIANAAQKASPTVLKTYPFALTIPSRISSSCRASAVRIVSRCASHNLVLPSMSVNRKVTVPVGASNSVEPIERMAVGIGFTRREAHSAKRARHTQPARSPRDAIGPSRLRRSSVTALQWAQLDWSAASNG
jgi:hypothetical protein